jgi:hypothetical protein
VPLISSKPAIPGITTQNDNFSPQLGSSQRIAVNDDRIHNTALLHVEGSEEFIYAAQKVFFLPVKQLEAGIQLCKIRPNAIVAIIVRIEDPNGANFYAFPSMAVLSVIARWVEETEPCVGRSAEAPRL